MRMKPVPLELYIRLYQEEILPVIEATCPGNTIWTSEGIAGAAKAHPDLAPTLAGYSGNLSRWIGKIMYRNSVRQRRKKTPVQWVIEK